MNQPTPVSDNSANPPPRDTAGCGTPESRAELIRHINRRGKEEWLTPDEAAARKQQRKGRRRSLQHSLYHSLDKLNIFRNMKLHTLMVTVCLLFMFSLMAVVAWHGMKKIPRLIGGIQIQTNLDNKGAGGASIYVDGDIVVGKNTPVLIPNLSSGLHFITIEKPGFHAHPPVLKVNVRPGDTAHAAFTLESIPLLGELTVTVTPAVPFTCFVDGIRIPIIRNQPIKLPIGMHTIAAFKDGHVAEPSFQRVLIDQSSPRSITFIFTPRLATGKLQVFGTPNSRTQVYLNGTPTGMMANGEAIPIPCGKHDVEVVGDIHSSSNAAPVNVDILPGQEHSENFRADPPRERLPFSIETSMPGANIMLDGKWLPYLTPWNTELPPGRHYVNFYRDGKWFDTKDRLFAIGVGLADKISVQF